MDSSLKQRLIGAAVLAALAILFLPMLLKGPDVKEPDAAEVPLSMPAAPDDKFETRELSLAAPEAQTPAGGVLGMDTVPAAATPGAEPVAAPLDSGVTPAPGAATLPTPAPSASTPAPAPMAAAPVPAPAAVAPMPVAAVPALPTPVAAAPKPVPPANVAAGNYALNIGTFANLDNANALVARLRAARLPVLTDSVRVKGASAMRVRIGPYLDRAAAEAARLRADDVAGGTARVIALDGHALPTTLPTAPAPKPVVATPVASPPAATKPAPVAPKPAPAPTSPASGFAVQLAAPAEESAALGLRDRARAAGFAAFVQKVDTDAGARYRVRIGPAADRAAAEALRVAASDKLGIAGNVVTHP